VEGEARAVCDASPERQSCRPTNPAPLKPAAPLSNFHPPGFLRYSLVVRWNKITLVGVGLLGGSLGLTIKRRRLARRVTGFVRRAATARDCRRLKVADEATLDLAAAVAGADLVIICTPLAQMRSLVKQMLPALKPGVIVTDVGSVKASVVKELEPLVAGAGGHFVGSHPMAGAEKTGVAASRPDLFECATCVVTPTRRTNAVALRKVEDFWKAVGGRLLRLTPEIHDALVSRSSHLPHVVAATLAHGVLDPARPKSQAALCANGFRDTTRIASGSPEMWRDIALANRRNVARALDGFMVDLRKFQRALANSDEKAVTRFFETAKQRRDRWCACCASPSPE
jgi:prephenate dehydrogenase